MATGIKVRKHETVMGPFDAVRVLALQLWEMAEIDASWYNDCTTDGRSEAVAAWTYGRLALQDAARAMGYQLTVVGGAWGTMPQMVKISHEDYGCIWTYDGREEDWLMW